MGELKSNSSLGIDTCARYFLPACLRSPKEVSNGGVRLGIRISFNGTLGSICTYGNEQSSSSSSSSLLRTYLEVAMLLFGGLLCGQKIKGTHWRTPTIGIKLNRGTDSYCAVIGSHDES